eukprot:6198151-Pleurochrysis_carterae.AAC.6
MRDGWNEQYENEKHEDIATQRVSRGKDFADYAHLRAEGKEGRNGARRGGKMVAHRLSGKGENAAGSRGVAK